MSAVVIINGPNLNMLGVRQPEIYGPDSFESAFESFVNEFKQLDLQYVQSNVEGELVSLIQEHGMRADYLIINAAAYTHTSIAIADAIAAVKAPCIGVHMSNIYKREKERHIDLIAKYCEACLFGFGMDSYRLALEYISKKG